MGVVTIYHIKSTALEQKSFDPGSLSPAVYNLQLLLLQLFFILFIIQVNLLSSSSPW